MDWAAAGLGRGQDVAQAKLLVEDFHAFYQKWHPVIKVPELYAGLEAAREHIEKNLVRGLERFFLAHLLEVIEAREDWWTSEQLLKMSVNFINVMKHAPPQLRPELEKVHREHMKKEFDPTTYYRDAEADAAAEEAKFRKALAGLEVDWPERVDAALRGRMEQLDGSGATAWQAEVSSKLAALGEKPVPMAENG
jgi:hypothetical protein